MKLSHIHPYFRSIPALVVLAVYCLVVGRSFWIHDSLVTRYRTLAGRAVETEQFELAQTYYERVLQLAGKREPEDEFNLMIAKFRSGDGATGQVLLDRLAPDDAPGYSKAHRMKAMQLVAVLAGGSTADLNAEKFGDGDPVMGPGGNEALDKGRGGQTEAQDNRSEPVLKPAAPPGTEAWELVRRHLSRSGLDNPVELADLWTAYYLAIGKPSDAIAQQMTAARGQPQRWLATARLCATLGDQNQRKRAAGEAELYWKAKLDENPLDHVARISLAQVMVIEDRIEDAGRLLSDGLKLYGNERSEPAVMIRRAASEIILLRLDKMPSEAAIDMETRYQWVSRAIQLDPNHGRAYGQLLRIFESDSSPEKRQAIIDMLQQRVVRGESIALAHFALGTAKWLDGKASEAIWHTQRALELDGNLTDVVNNFAWLIAHNDPPDLNRALQLIDTALTKRPADYRYRDTRGTILMKLERWDNALNEFESILPQVPPGERPVIHEKLAEIYKALGRDEIARQHRDQATSKPAPSD